MGVYIFDRAFREERQRWRPRRLAAPAMTAAVILAGGRSRRLGTPKEDALVGGMTLLERTLAACVAADPIVVVGPDKPRLDRRIVQVRESPVHGGPVAALLAALPALEYALTDSVVVLACDMPRVAELVIALPSLTNDVDAVIARDRGHVQALAGIYRISSLVQVVTRAPAAGASMHSLLGQLRCKWIDVPVGCTDDVDTPADLAAARTQ